MMRSKVFQFAVMLFFAMGVQTQATETSMTIRVQSHDAKFVGSSVGGMKVVVSDVPSGAVLAHGMIEGGTGDTKRIMMESIDRRDRLADDRTAVCIAKLDIQEPTKVNVEVSGPLGAGLNMHTASKTLWVLPGHDIDGDGLMFDMPGLIVHVVSPPPNQQFKEGQTVNIEANVTMICGCPIWPDGIWDTKEFVVTAKIMNTKGEKVAELPLKYAGETSRFKAAFDPPAKGGYKVVITASQDAADNYGLAVTGFAVK